MILRLEQICKRYSHPSRCKVALDGASLELGRGELVGIFGASGSGKTTLLRIAAGLETPDAGLVTYRGERLDQMSATQIRRYRRREVGCVWAPQGWPQGLSVLEQVALPLLVDGADRRAADRVARRFLSACEAEECTDLEPRELSEGERQRVAIARALVAEPRLLLADGAVSSLSLVEQEGIMLLLASLAREAKVGVVITDSDASALLGADPVLYLRDGRLASADPANELGELLHLPTAASRRFAADA